LRKPRSYAHRPGSNRPVRGLESHSSSGTIPPSLCPPRLGGGSSRPSRLTVDVDGLISYGQVVCSFPGAGFACLDVFSTTGRCGRSAETNPGA